MFALVLSSVCDFKYVTIYIENLWTILKKWLSFYQIGYYNETLKRIGLYRNGKLYT